MSAGARAHAWLGAVLVVLSCSACAGAQSAGVIDVSNSVVAQPVQSSAPAEAPVNELLIDFDSVPLGRAVSDGTVLTSEAGATAVARSGPVQARAEIVEGPTRGATALQFPALCDDGQSCLKLIVEVPAEEAPQFYGDVRFGAVIRIPPGQTSTGSNVMQRGFSTGDRGQWKLQVDGARGVPSCVLVEVGSKEIHTAWATSPIADDEWHEVVCERRGGTLEVLVNGASEGKASLGTGLIAPDGPVRIGGKNVKEDNDQFHGAISHVFFERL